MIKKPLILAAIFLFSQTACQLSRPEPEVRGKAFFASFKCDKCHTVDSEGGTLGPDLTFVGFRKTPEFLDTWLTDPHDWKPNVSMPNFHLSENVRKDIVAYLSTLTGDSYLEGHRPWGTGQDGTTAERGKRIFDTVGCVTCHGKDGAGGYPNNNVTGGEIPAIDKASEGFTREELIQKITVGVPEPVLEDMEGEKPLLHMPAWGTKLREDEIAAVADYLISLSPEGADDEDGW